MLHIQSFVFNPFSQNTYLVYDNAGQALLIDPGNFSDSETATLQNFINQKKLQIRKIVLTHAHIDHVLGLQWAADTYQVPVFLHELEQEILDRNPLDAKRFGFFFKPFAGERRYLAEGEELELGTEKFEILHVPGHSPGSIVFYHPGQNFMISGDVLFQGSIGRTDLYKGATDLLLSGIENKLFVLPDETQVYSGHGNMTTIGAEKKSNPFFSR